MYPRLGAGEAGNLQPSTGMNRKRPMESLLTLVKGQRNGQNSRQCPPHSSQTPREKLPQIPSALPCSAGEFLCPPGDSELPPRLGGEEVVWVCAVLLLGWCQWCSAGNFHYPCTCMQHLYRVTACKTRRLSRIQSLRGNTLSAQDTIRILIPRTRKISFEWEKTTDTIAGMIQNVDSKAGTINALTSNYKHVWNKWKNRKSHKKIDIKKNQQTLKLKNIIMEF